MSKTRKLTFAVIVLGVALVAIFAYSKSFLEVRYYEAFKYINTGKDTRKIIFINELNEADLDNRWHIEVYFDGDGKWLKFNNIRKLTLLPVV